MQGTDGAHWRDVLLTTRVSALSWQPQVRLLGNVRAGDIARAIDEAIAERDELAREVERLRAERFQGSG